MLHENAKANDREEFLDEIEFMKNLEFHPHILSLIACSTNPIFPLILTGICEFGDLLNLLRKINEQNSNITFEDLVPIAWQICDALVFLSEKKIIHRDVAARNVLLTQNKTAKLSDFGLCRVNKEQIYRSRGGKFPIKWMAPEAIEFCLFSSKSDVWSFGIVLYEMYSFGKTPFCSLDNGEVLQFLKDGNRLEIPSEAPKMIKEIMNGCWKGDPSDRVDLLEIRDNYYKEMEKNTHKYEYLSFSKGYYRLCETR
ncbi:unnamed protein product, partial [Mesorhabditis belari]|uniref:Protein kinase domain-containing protein n=1 Tax=Mesorhabditis belari TaxID=2138241 RepID=A0AAF3F5S7_9BILA